MSNLICTHCGKTLENESQLFCAFCGYPVGDTKKGFFAKTEETGELPSAQSPVQPSSMMSQMAQPVPQPNGMAQMAQMSMPMGMMGMMPQMSMMQGMMPYMGMMPNVMSQMSVMQGQQNLPENDSAPVKPENLQAGQQMMQNPMMMGVAGMPQMMGYDSNGNPIYIQMMPQIMGYDPYGNPIYAMIPVPCAMPKSQSNDSTETAQEPPKPASVSVQGRAISQPIAKKEMPAPEKIEEQPAPEPTPEPEPEKTQEEEQIPSETPVSQKSPVANARRVGQPIQEGFFARQVKMQNPVANGVAIRPTEPPKPKPEPLQEEHEEAEEFPVSADLLMMSEEEQELPNEEELLDSIFSSGMKKYTLIEDVEPSAKTFSISLSASEVTTVRRRKTSSIPDTLDKVPSPPQSREQQLFSKVEEDLPPPMAMYDKPPQKDPNAYSRSKSRHQPFQPQNNNSWQQPAQSYSQQQSGTSVQYQQAKPYPQQGMNSQYQAQPYPQQGMNSQYQQAQPYPQQGMNSYQQGQPSSQQGMNSHQYPPQPYPQQSQSYQYQQSQAYPQQNAQPYQQPPPYQPQQSQYFQGQISAKQPEIPEPQEKILPSKVERPMPKAEKPKHKSTEKRPAKIVDAAAFFGDQPVKSRGDLGVTIVDNMSDEQLAAQLARMQYGGRKKSRRSMKAATELEADYSNIPADMLPSDS